MPGIGGVVPLPGETPGLPSAFKKMRDQLRACERPLPSESATSSAPVSPAGRAAAALVCLKGVFSRTSRCGPPAAIALPEDFT